MIVAATTMSPPPTPTVYHSHEVDGPLSGQARGNRLPGEWCWSL